MYDHFVGEVCAVAPARVALRAGGIGYELKVPMSTSAGLRVGDKAHLWVVLHVVDGMPTLLGFRSARERELARRLLTVSGVGPAIALALLSTYGPGEIARAIVQDEPAVLQKVKGIGAKTAERLCLELRDHVAKLDLGDVRAEPAAGALPDAAADAVAALVTLGYSEKEARAKVEKAAGRTPKASTEDLVKSVLRG